MELVRQTKALGRLPVVNFAAGGVATPADAALMMQVCLLPAEPWNTAALRLLSATRSIATRMETMPLAGCSWVWMACLWAAAYSKAAILRNAHVPSSRYLRPQWSQWWLLTDAHSLAGCDALQ